MLLLLVVGSCLLHTIPAFCDFAPLTVPVSTGQQCEDHVPDISEVLKTVEETLSKSSIPAAQPTSCLEVKEGSPNSPSGYYTLSDGNGSFVIVYCNMDDLYSCPSIEQLLNGLQNKYNSILTATETLSEDIQNNYEEIITMTEKLNSNQETIQQTVASTSNQVLNLTYKQDQAFESTDSSISQVSNNVNDILDFVTKNLFTSCNGTTDATTDATPENSSAITYNNSSQSEALCNTTGPWTRVAYLNMSDDTHNCPSAFKEIKNNTDGVRACARPIMDIGCVSVTFPTNSTSYSQVCGRVIGYQFLSSHGFRHEEYTEIDEPYVDGVSLTHGSPRQHIWTFAAEGLETVAWCPCAAGSTVTSKVGSTFIGNDYYCEAGNSIIPIGSTLYSTDPLWDGEDCNSAEAQCCQVPGIPWFHKVLATPSTNDIELRVCAGVGTTGDNPGVGLYEIYIM